MDEVYFRLYYLGDPMYISYTVHRGMLTRSRLICKGYSRALETSIFSFSEWNKEFSSVDKSLSHRIKHG